MKKSQELYTQLLKECTDVKDLTKNVQKYHSFLNYSEFNALCEQSMFKCGLIQRQEYFEKIPGLQDECKKCWKFYLSPRNKSIKKYDVIYGKKYENIFINFLMKMSITSVKADKKDAVLPDNLILDKSKNTLAYYEVKYHNAPFVWVYKNMKGRECYEGSITLDYEKVKRQIGEIRKLTDLPVLYLHWVDFPCIKGIFYMTLEDTQKELELGVDFERNAREGDYIISSKGKKKVGYQKKFYPSILKMKNLEDFIRLFN
jgi:hypothetical protein